MERIRRIMEHPLYQKNQQRIEELEQNRFFCRHGIGHSLDVARILYILVLEREVCVPKDVVYAAALLHDIGRAVQYEEKRPHHEAGAELAEVILKECGYEPEEIDRITKAIASHQINSGDKEEYAFGSLLYEADKLSRNCFSCQAQSECYWENSKKNSTLQY